MDAPPRLVETTRIFTFPNVLSMLRLLGVPLFLWLVLGPQEDWWALLVLAVAGVTDWLDGQAARWLGQVSRFGRLLDPFADRLYIFAVLIGLVLRGVVPLWLAVLLVLRDVTLAALLPLLRRYGRGIPPVHFLGKAGTFCLLYAFPLLFLGQLGGSVAVLASVFGWAFAIWGTGLYWWSGILYVGQIHQLIRQSRGRVRRAGQRRMPP